MELNNLDVKAINPKNGDKYSPNLFKFLSRRDSMARFGNVYRDKDGLLWLGFVDEEFWFTGTRLIAVLCQGTKVQTGAYPPLVGRELTLVNDFWARYIHDGRCAIDRNHEMFFMNDKERFQVKGIFRKCRWCGAEQKKRVVVKRVKSERWVTRERSA